MSIDNMAEQAGVDNTQCTHCFPMFRKCIHHSACGLQAAVVFSPFNLLYLFLSLHSTFTAPYPTLSCPGAFDPRYLHCCAINQNLSPTEQSILIRQQIVELHKSYSLSTSKTAINLCPLRQSLNMLSPLILTILPALSAILSSHRLRD